MPKALPLKTGSLSKKRKRTTTLAEGLERETEKRAKGKKQTGPVHGPTHVSKKRPGGNKRVQLEARARPQVGNRYQSAGRTFGSGAWARKDAKER